jgi:hypothetical protein
MAVIYGTTITVPTIVGTHTGFVAQIKTGDVPALMLNGANQINNGGGNLQVYTNDTLSTRLAVDIVECVTGGSPSFLAYVRMPSAATGQTLYLAADDTQTVQPIPSALYGRNDTYQDEISHHHLNDTSWTDVTGNGHDGVATGTPTISTANNPWGGSWTEFSTGVVEYLTLNSSGNITDNLTEGMIQAWVYPNTKTTSGIISNRSSTQGDNFTQLSNRGLANQWQAAFHDGSGEATTLPGVAGIPCLLTMVWNTTTLNLYVNTTAGTPVSMVSDGKLVTAKPYTIGSYFDFSAGRSFDGYIGEVVIKAAMPNSDRIATQLSNQTSSTWFTNDGWNAVSGGSFKPQWAIHSNQILTYF